MRVYVASKINCPQKNVYLVQNATDAINCLLKSMKWKEGDTILLPNTAYASIRKTVTVIQARYNVTIIDVTPF
jgi:selenocysteine lyase/cysteine desulfurase